MQGSAGRSALKAALSHEERRELTHSMLIALLEHQFCASVDWIGTQESLINAVGNHGRMVEIGPSKILTPMFEKTLKLPELRRSQKALRCDFYSPVTDQRSGSSEDGDRPKKEAPPMPKTATPPRSNKSAGTTTTSSSTAPSTTGADPTPASPLAQKRREMSVDTADVVACVVSAGLRVPKRDVENGQSIKQLSKGRSVVQNEVLGDLAALFGVLPDMAEGLPLGELSRELSKGFGGTLTPAMLSWLHKRVSTKLPPTLNAARLREYLEASFGFPASVQSAFLVSMDCESIKGQVRNTEAARALIDEWARDFARQHGLGGDVPTEIGKGSGPGSSVAGAATPPVQHQSQKRPLPATDPRSIAWTEEVDASDELDHLHQELGDDFIDGVKGIFDIEKVFKYESAWNWALQDLYVTVESIVNGSGSGTDVDYYEADIQRLRNRADPRLRKCAHNLEQRLSILPQTAERDVCQTVLRRILAPHEADDQVQGCEKIDSHQEHDLALVTEQTGRPESEVRDSPSSSWSSSSVFTLKSHDIPVGVFDVTNNIVPPEMHSQVSLRGPTEGSTVLVIGAGTRSIGSALVERLLAAGCRVVVTTSQLNATKRNLYSDIYKQRSRQGSKLVVLPFNQASREDVENLIDYVHLSLQWEIDHVFPFAAISESGRTVEDLDSRSELAHRIMLTNTLRLVGAIAASKRSRGVINHFTQVILPLSPNHGQFGGDGLYGESKLALEAMFNKWHTEPWSEYVSICGASIGWTRETGLMAALDSIVEEMERQGIKTYSTDEMASSLVQLMSPGTVDRCCQQPVFCDLSGGLAGARGLRQKMERARDVVAARNLENRERVNQTSEAERSNAEEGTRIVQHRANLQPGFPQLEAWEKVQGNLEGLLDLSSVVVVAGFAELGPCGSSRTRWEMESQGTLSLEGTIELAWMTGLIKWQRERSLNRQALGCGWVVVASGEPIEDHEIAERFRPQLMDGCGLRIVRPGDHDPKDSTQLERLEEVVTDRDMPAFEAPVSVGRELQKLHGDRCQIHRLSSDLVAVTLLKGAAFYVPKAAQVNHFVAGQLPDGWDPSRYGIPTEIISQVDRLSLYGLVCTADAMLSAGILDTYELYRHAHVSDVGNCLGSGMGGLSSMQAVNHLEAMGTNDRSDALAEMFVNTPAAWVNMLLLSSSGPIKTPAGACATGLESLDTGADLIRAGKAKFCLVGGQDTYSSAVAHGFSRMHATVDAEQQLRCGREPREMSRPTTTTRSGFVQSEGCGVQLLTSASMAIEMGLPIYGVVALTHMASDKISRSVPAPGQGVLTAARQANIGQSLLLTDLDLRRKRIDLSLRHLQAKEEMEIEAAQEELRYRKGEFPDVQYETMVESATQKIRSQTHEERRGVLRQFGNECWQNDPNVSPIAGSLAAFGLSIDDLTFASLHGTSTKANDVNECDTINRQLENLQRGDVNPVFTVFQKWLTGHGLGAAGSWMLNGALQSLQTGIIPGNKNADDIDPQLKHFSRLLYTSTNINLRKEAMKACSVTSFGFGQKGAQAILLHPRHVFGALSEIQYREYSEKNSRRCQRATQAFAERICMESVVQIKTRPPYEGEDQRYLLDPNARIGDEALSR